MPQIGVEIAVVSRVAVTTQVKAAWSPPMSWMITGSDVETTVAARIETNMPSRSPERDCSTFRCDMGSVDGRGFSGGHVRAFHDGESATAMARWLTWVNYTADR